MRFTCGIYYHYTLLSPIYTQYRTMQVLPDPTQAKSKKIQVAEMFDAISPRYDMLNRLLSLRTDVYWRKQALAALLPHPPKQVLDVATGTADFALQAAALLPDAKIWGIDLSAGMLSVGQQKVERAKLQDRISLKQADAEAIPFPDNHFDAAVVAFGIRNFENPEKGLNELYRVLKPGGRLIILEFSTSNLPVVGIIFRLYFHYIMPYIGRFISGHTSAYTYLPRSVAHFSKEIVLTDMLAHASFQQIICKQLSLGIVSMYFAHK